MPATVRAAALMSTRKRLRIESSIMRSIMVGPMLSPVRALRSLAGVSRSSTWRPPRASVSDLLTPCLCRRDNKERPAVLREAASREAPSSPGDLRAGWDRIAERLQQHDPRAKAWPAMLGSLHLDLRELMDVALAHSLVWSARRRYRRSTPSRLPDSGESRHQRETNRS